MFETEKTANVVAFRRRKPATQHHPRTLIERIYAAGSLPVPADDVATKMAARMLQRLGFLVIEEVAADGTLRPLAPGETRRAMDRPWRLSKPAFAGEPGRPDGDGTFRI